jgi:phosphatidate cytidylyltransferase
LSDTDEPEDRRTEGVRIIGAHEAAEAAERPDVVQRRTGAEKRYGDRPDEPEVTSDLPKITISTTEGEGQDPTRFGAVPVVRPGEDGEGDEPRWSDHADGSDDPDPREGFGHARLLEESDDPQRAPDPEEPIDATTVLEPADPSGDLPRETRGASSMGQDQEEAEVGRQDPSWGSASSVVVGSEDFLGVPDPDPASLDEPGDATQPWSTADFGDVADLGVLAEDADQGPDGDLDSGSYGWTDEPAPPAQDAMGDDSFVLPHWTEPPTGQVPKVVVGDDLADPELATYGSQPRWRDEGERGEDTDFDDLIDDGPRLGALGGGTGDRYFDDSVEDDPDPDMAEYDQFDEDADATDDEELEPSASVRRRPRRQAERSDGSGGGSSDRNLISAIAVGVGLVALGLVCFALGAVPTTILATVVVGRAGWEYFSAVRRSGHNPATLLGMVSIIGLMVAAYTSGLAAYPVVLGLSALAGLIWYLWVAPGEGGVRNLGLTLLGVLWIGTLGSFATLFLGLGRVVQESDAGITSNPGIGVLIAAVVAAVSHDVGAYFVGRQFGRTPLSAASPNKTQEGMVGGVLVSLLVTIVVVGLVGLDPLGSDLAQVFIFALVCALAAPLGDLAESFVKRDLDIKDMGAVLPGHGGVLDRFDALLFVLPVAYFVTVLFGLWSGVS